jgi:hypothetical protein
MEAFDAQRLVIGPALEETMEKREILQRNLVKMVAVFNDSQAGIWWAAHLDARPRTVASKTDQSKGAGSPHPLN